MNVILLKHGTKYTAQDVNSQAETLLNFADYPIFCLTEDPKDVIIECLPIPDSPKLMRWWNKLHVFRHDFILDNHCVMFDLDIHITDNPFPYIESIDWRYPTFIEDVDKSELYHKKHAYETMLNSSVMAWTSYRNTEYWDIFSRNIDYYTRKYKGVDRYITDQNLHHRTFNNAIRSTIVF